MPRHVLIAADMPATPDRLYDMYLDAKTHAAFTGHPVTINARPGSPFSAFGGILTGTMLHAKPKQFIAQTWRSVRWPADAMDSVLTIAFHAQPGGARIELAHANVPDSDYAGICQGWHERYFQPWRAYLAANAGEAANG